MKHSNHTLTLVFNGWKHSAASLRTLSSEVQADGFQTFGNSEMSARTSDKVCGLRIKTCLCHIRRKKLLSWFSGWFWFISAVVLWLRQVATSARRHDEHAAAFAEAQTEAVCL